MTDKLAETIRDAADESLCRDITPSHFAFAAADAVRAMVPELVWSKHPDEEEYYFVMEDSSGIEHGYMILPRKKGFALYSTCSRTRARLSKHKTSRDAKAAANAHNRDRIAKMAGWV